MKHARRIALRLTTEGESPRAGPGPHRSRFSQDPWSRRGRWGSLLPAFFSVVARDRRFRMRSAGALQALLGARRENPRDGAQEEHEKDEDQRRRPGLGVLGGIG